MKGKEDWRDLPLERRESVRTELSQTCKAEASPRTNRSVSAKSDATHELNDERFTTTDATHYIPVLTVAQSPP